MRTRDPAATEASAVRTRLFRSAAAAHRLGRSGGTATSSQPSPIRRFTKLVLFVAFAFTIMADLVSSVAYTIEASLRALNGHLGLLMATQLIVLGIILLVDVNYWQLVARFPMGGGSAEAAARAYGPGWVFVPIGALIVDFVLTITISVAAGVSALISYLPSIASVRIFSALRCLAAWLGLPGSATAAD